MAIYEEDQKAAQLEGKLAEMRDVISNLYHSDLFDSLFFFFFFFFFFQELALNDVILIFFFFFNSLNQQNRKKIGKIASAFPLSSFFYNKIK